MLPSSVNDIWDAANKSWARILRRLEMTCVEGDMTSRHESARVSDVFVCEAMSSSAPSPIDMWNEPANVGEDMVSAVVAMEELERRACPLGRGGGRECVMRGGSVFVWLVEGVGACVSRGRVRSGSVMGAGTSSVSSTGAERSVFGERSCCGFERGDVLSSSSGLSLAGRTRAGC